MKDRVLEAETREILRRLKETRTLKELQAATGVSNVVLSKYLGGKSISPKTLRSIRSWLGQEEGPVETELVEWLGRALGPLSPASRAKIFSTLRTAIEKAYVREERKLPVWLKSPELDVRFPNGVDT